MLDGPLALNSSDMFAATDCINGTILPKGIFGKDQTNYTVLIDVHLKHGPEHKLDEVMRSFGVLYKCTETVILKETTNKDLYELGFCISLNFVKFVFLEFYRSAIWQI